MMITGIIDFRYSEKMLLQLLLWENLLNSVSSRVLIMYKTSPCLDSILMFVIAANVENRPEGDGTFLKTATNV